MNIKPVLTIGLIALLTGLYFMARPNRNIRNNNPLNVRESADWLGEKALNLDSAFEEFKAPEYGFRAAYIILLQYLERGENTIERIISTWAPSIENHTSGYIAYISDKMQLAEYDEIIPSDLPNLMVHMANFEGAQGAFSFSQSLAGAKLAMKEDFVIARLSRLDGAYV